MLARLQNIEMKKDFEQLADNFVGVKVVRYMLNGMPYKRTFYKQKEYDELIELSVDNSDLKILEVDGTDFPLQ
jgi:hypothetical protein